MRYLGKIRGQRVWSGIRRFRNNGTTVSGESNNRAGGMNSGGKDFQRRYALHEKKGWLVL
jgi:hypothetical protein